MSSTAVLENPTLKKKSSFIQNYWFLIIERGLYVGGIAFVLPETVLPGMVRSFGGPDWVLALIPMLMQLGSLGPPLFVAQIIQKKDYLKRYIVTCRTLQRIPYLVTGLILIFLPYNKNLMLMAGLMVPLLSGLFVGFSITAYQEYIAKAIPSTRRSSMWGFQHFLGTSLGFAGGKLVYEILEANPGKIGYGYLHLVSFGIMAVGLALLYLTRETKPSVHAPDSIIKPSNFFKIIPSMVKNDSQLRNYLLARFSVGGVNVIFPFLSVFTLDTLQKPDKFLGMLVSARMFGAMLGNAMAGYLGDKFGGRKIMLLGKSISAVMLALIPLAHSELLFIIVFFLLGCGFNMMGIGAQTLGFEIAPKDKRIAYLTSMAVLTLLGLGFSTGITILIRHFSINLLHLVGFSFAALAISFAGIWLMYEPRFTGKEVT